MCALSKGMTTTMPEGYQLDARNTVLDADDVHARYHWARTVGYQRTGQYAKTGTSWRGMPLPIGKVWRLNLLMACEDRAAAGTMPAAPVAAIPAQRSGGRRKSTPEEQAAAAARKSVRRTAKSSAAKVAAAGRD